MSEIDRERRREISRKSHAKVVAQRKAQGRCWACGKRPAKYPGGRCGKCIRAATERGKRREAAFKAASRCRICGKSRDNRTTYCNACLKKRRRYDGNKARKRDGLTTCTQCGKPRDCAGRTCVACRKKRRQHYLKRIGYCYTNGLCYYCPSGGERPTVTKGKLQLCFDCWLAAIAKNNLKDKDRAGELRRLWDEQEGRCAYTGVELRPGDNASLDHRTPVSRGGGNESTNLQWIDYVINTMKYNRTHEEFIAWCAAVAVRFGAARPI